MKYINNMKYNIYIIFNIISLSLYGSIEHTLNTLEQLYTHAATQNYIGECISQQEHALQAATYAQQLCRNQTFEDTDLIIAAFLHDIGHILEHSTTMDNYGALHHEIHGAQWLQEHNFSPKVIALVQEHVNAKRYLVYKNQNYYEQLSDASKQTLTWQGGPMTTQEALAFEQHPYYNEILQLRTCDEHAKIPYAPTLSLTDMLHIIKQHLIQEALPDAVYLITMPRSCSTACTVMMHNMGHFQIINEPGIDPYLIMKFGDNAPDRSLNTGTTLTTFEQVQSLILQQSMQTKSLFIKDMACCMEHYLIDHNFLQHHSYKTIFLIRDPLHELLSFYQKLPKDDEWIQKEMCNYEVLYTLYQFFEQHQTTPPLVILAEDLVNYPRQSIQRICSYLKIPFEERMTSWKQLGTNFALEKEWICEISSDLVQHWFSHALNSTHFEKKSYDYAYDSDGNPTFEEITNLEHRQTYNKLYQHNKLFYDIFVQLKQ